MKSIQSAKLFLRMAAAFLAAALLLLPVYAFAGSSAPLFPAYDEETGKYGYIDANGQWAIQPQFEEAHLFRGHYAAVSTGDPWDSTMGVIDETGTWVVEPQYFVDEGYDGWTYGGLNEGIYQVWDEDMHTGWFDVPSGYFSGLVDSGELRWWTKEKLVPIGNGFYNRTNGQLVFSLPEGYETDWLNNSSVFTYGFAPIFRINEDDDFSSICFVSTQGEIRDPDHLLFNEEDWACGLLRATEKETVSGDPPITGYFDLNTMKWLILSCAMPDGQISRFLEACPFSGNGYACVKLDNGDYGHIDRHGNLLFSGSVSLKKEDGEEYIHITQPYKFFGDYAWIEEAGALIGPDGNAVLQVPDGWTPEVQWDDELDSAKDYYFSPGGIVELRKPVSGGGYKTGLMKRNGEWLLDPETYGRNWSETAEWHRFFSEGLQPVVKIIRIKEWRTVHTLDGDTQKPVSETRVGYVNEQGETIVDFLYDDGGPFMNGLAMVKKGNLIGYVNTEGEEVFFWTSGDSPDS